MIKEVVIPKVVVDVFNSLVDIANVELVGLLLGSIRYDSVYVEELVIGENIDYSSTSFRLDPHAIIAAYDLAKMLSLDIVALIHSHPAPPYPSPKDLAGMRLWPIPWVIVDSITREVRVWALDKGLVEVKLVIT